MTFRANQGSTLIEVLVAMLVFVSGVLAIAQLFLVAAVSNAAARDTTIAATLAAQKIEELLSSELSESADLVDHIDQWGRVLRTGGFPPQDAVYTRRWSIESLSGDTVAIRVRVGRTDRSGGSGWMAGETRLLTIKSRTRS
jgi:Tfp pilus assembly protein PilV